MNIHLRNWIAEKLQKVPSADRFVLFHASVDALGGASGERLEMYSVEEVQGDPEAESERISDEIMAHVRVHCEAFDGLRQRYKVVAETNADDMLGSFPFAIGTRQESIDVGLSEPANERGLLGQLMRHNENMTRHMVEMAQAVVGPVVAENQALRRQRDDWESRRLETFMTLEELHSMKHVRDLELKDYEDSQKRRAQFWKALIGEWGPQIISKLQLSGMPPEIKAIASNALNGIGTRQEALRDVFRALDRKSIYKALDDEQRDALDSLLGLGEPLKDTDDFNAKLHALWATMPDEIADSIPDQLDAEQKAKLVALLNL